MFDIVFTNLTTWATWASQSSAPIPAEIPQWISSVINCRHFFLRILGGFRSVENGLYIALRSVRTSIIQVKYVGTVFAHHSPTSISQRWHIKCELCNIFSAHRSFFSPTPDRFSLPITPPIAWALKHKKKYFHHKRNGQNFVSHRWPKKKKKKKRNKTASGIQT